MTTIRFPAEVRSDINGYLWLAQTASALEPLKAQKVHLDASRLRWFDANLCGPLGAVLSRARTKINSFDWDAPPGKVLEIWMKNGFSIHLPSVGLPDTYDTTIAYRRFALGEERAFVSYVSRELLTEGRLPRVTEGAKRRLEGYFHEVFNNAALHSASSAGVWTCGQHFPTKERLDFAVTDLGLGFGDKVRGFLRDDKKDAACIEWAMQPGNTTRTGDIPGGLGLKRLRDFIADNGGQLHIVSGDGCWFLHPNGKVSSHTLARPFAGTLLNLSFNTQNDEFYGEDEALVEEISLF